jgi:hypothetical protein
MMLSTSKSEINVPALLPSMFFAYQKSNREILGSGEKTLIHPMLATLELVYNKQKIDLTKGKTLDEVFDNFAKELEKTGYVKGVHFEKTQPLKYIFHIDNCRFAPHVHDLLHPKDITCPFAIMAETLFQKVTAKEVRANDSNFTKTGQKTIIEPII